MRLSAIIELLLIFLFLAFAASRVIGESMLNFLLLRGNNLTYDDVIQYFVVLGRSTPRQLGAADRGCESAEDEGNARKAAASPSCCGATRDAGRR